MLVLMGRTCCVNTCRRLMEALLKNGFINRVKPEIFYEMIKSFATVKNKRNTYAHGLWFTHERPSRPLGLAFEFLNELFSLLRHHNGRYLHIRGRPCDGTAAGSLS